jgi:hypothetical protein
MAMPQTVYYSAPEVKIGAASVSAVDLSEFAKSAVLVRQADALESSSMASRDRFYQAGMNTNSLTVTFNQSYEAAEVYATIGTASRHFVLRRVHTRGRHGRKRNKPNV